MRKTGEWWRSFSLRVRFLKRRSWMLLACLEWTGVPRGNCFVSSLVFILILRLRDSGPLESLLNLLLGLFSLLERKTCFETPVLERAFSASDSFCNCQSSMACCSSVFCLKTALLSSLDSISPSAYCLNLIIQGLLFDSKS